MGSKIYKVDHGTHQLITILLYELYVFTQAFYHRQDVTQGQCEWVLCLVFFFCECDIIKEIKRTICGKREKGGGGRLHLQKAIFLFKFKRSAKYTNFHIHFHVHSHIFTHLHTHTLSCTFTHIHKLTHTHKCMNELIWFSLNQNGFQDNH